LVGTGTKTLPNTVFRMTREKPRRVVRWDPADPVSGKLYRDQRMRACPGGMWIVRSGLFQRHRMDERFQGWGCEDTEFLRRIPWRRLPESAVSHLARQGVEGSVRAQSAAVEDCTRLAVLRATLTHVRWCGEGGPQGTSLPDYTALQLFDEAFGYHGLSNEKILLVFPESSVVPVPYAAQLCCVSDSDRKSLIVRSMDAPTFPSDSTQSWFPVLLYFRTTCSKPPCT